MRQATVADLGLGNLLKHSGKSVPENSKTEIGVLAFDVARLMSKVVNLWRCLSDKEICSLREEIVNSIGVQKLVSNDANYLMDLVLNEIMENFVLVGRSVAMLGRKCTDTLFRRFEHFVNDPIQNHVEWHGWEYRLKKMEKKVKKMERFVGVTIQMAQELEVLAELEQTFRRMQANADLNRRKLQDVQQRVIWQHQEVRSLREMSPWVRTYDYIVRLLARSLLTILERIKLVCQINSSYQLPSAEQKGELRDMNPHGLFHSLSCSPLMLSPIHPSENMVYDLSSGPIRKSIVKLGPIPDESIIKKKSRHHWQLPILYGKLAHAKTKQLAHVGAFKGCVISGNSSPIPQIWEAHIGGSMKLHGTYLKPVDKAESKMESLSLESLSISSRIYYKLAVFNSKRRMFSAPSATLGDAALAFHYANLIVFIEKLVSSPHMLDSETREDLYNMLPTAIRVSLNARLKIYAKSLAPALSLVTEWSVALSRILEWLSPLAHNTIRWLAERNFERKEENFGTNVLLVQTLHFANQAKTEAVITELLVGLNYIYQINADDASERPRQHFSSWCRPCHGYMGKRVETIPQQSYRAYEMKMLTF